MKELHPEHQHPRRRMCHTILWTSAIATLLVGCSKPTGAENARALQYDSARPDVPFVMFHRFPAYPGPRQELICGPIVAVWQNGRIVRIADEDSVGKRYVEGTLDPARLEDLKGYIQANPKLLVLKDSQLIFDAADEQMGIRFEGTRVLYAETLGDFEQIRHDPDMAALRKYLMSLEIADPRLAERPWLCPPEDWYR